MPDWSYVHSSQRVCSLLKSAIIFFLVSSLAIFGCQSSGNNNSDVKLDWQIEPDPPKVGMARINFTLRDSTDQLLTDADVKLEGNMSHPGMKPVLATAEEVEPGHYSAEFEFIMGGDWFILIKSTLADDRVVQKQINIFGVRPE